MNHEDRPSQIQPGYLPPRLMIERREHGAVLFLRLSGFIDEQFDGPGLARTLRGRYLVLDLGGVDRISSFGIRQWIDFISATRGRLQGVYFIEVSPKMVDQFNMVANFGGHGHIVSFFAPYRCDACDHDRRRLFRTDEETPLWRAGQAPPFSCPSCGSQEYFDEDPATYFCYVAQQPPPQLPPEVASFLRNELNYGQGGQRKLKIEKTVEGRFTYVKLSGDLDSDLRAQKLAEGLEGDVVFDLAGVLSIDPVGTAQWRKLLQSLASRTDGSERVDNIYIVAAPALFLERLGRPEDLTHKGKVLSVLVPYACPRCRATTQRLVDFCAYGQELRAGRVPRTRCSACGSPATCMATETWLQRLAALPQPVLDEAQRQGIARLLSATSRPVPPPAGLPPQEVPLETTRPQSGPPVRDTRPLGWPALGPLKDRVRRLLQLPGLLPGSLVVLMALSAAIVYRILTPPEQRRGSAGWVVVEASQAQPPSWAVAAPPADGLTFWGRSARLPDRQQAVEAAEREALLALARNLGETLAERDPLWRTAVMSLYEGAEEAARRSRIHLSDAEQRVVALVRQVPGVTLRPKVYWEKLARGNRRTGAELTFQATAWLRLEPREKEQLLTHFSRREVCQKASFFPYFPMLGWRHELGMGAVLGAVDPQSRLGGAGLQPKDIVVSVSGHEVENLEELCRLLNEALAAGEGSLKVQRGARLLELPVAGRPRRPRRSP
ncbi:MAG: hypothetical protein RMK29_17420 [Myxococcales bacterium]|nr:hypothetical protein [Myxococcota bacterium]MDW8283491.1 hypothetical protein [Myxococcales bacterium]